VPRTRPTNITNRVFSLAILFGLAAIVLLTPVFESGLSGGQATFCLGFILLFGYYLAKLLEGFHLPAITSYIIVGIVCGPYVINLLSSQVLNRLEVFDDVALAIIALIAGGEMRLRVIRARKAAFGAVIAGQVLFAFVGSVAVVYLLPGFLAGMPTGGLREVLAVGMLLGLVVVARSPSTTIGVVTETRSRGPMTEVLVGVTVLLDVVVLIMAAFVIPASEVLLDPALAFSLGFVKILGVSIAGSIAAGALFGWLISLYIRWIGGYLPIILLVVGLVGSAVCRLHHLEPLLAFMIAGFIVENYSTQGDRLIKGLERSAFPVYVVFFAISGAAIDLGALREMWLFALILVGVRAAAYYAGTLAAARVVGELKPYAHSVWSGFLAQAGVTIGIASLIERTFEWGTSLETIVLAVVALNQLVGPILLKWLLERKGEAGGMDR
jgi:Kef-type K+ transport system membrane component KefB